jgi:tetratricopeptide (TPR) repeat protein
MTDKDLVFVRRFENWSLAHPRYWTVATDTTGITGFISAQIDRVVKAQIETADNIIVSQERIRSEIDRAALGIDRVADGLESLAATFEWGFSELVWHLEEQREILRDILRVLQAPLDTQAKELKKRAEYAYRNGWFNDALEDFLESQKKNRYDFTIHQNLGNIYFFEKKNPEKALEYYEKAAKYATPGSPYHASIAFLHIGLIRYLQGNFQKAWEATLKASELSPGLYEAHYQHAQYCANLGKYSEAVEHIKIAITGDRYYCVKADSEKDFDAMKEQLISLFKELREKACDWAGKEIKIAEELVQDAESYSVPNESIVVAKKELDEAENLFKRDSYFDYLNAGHNAKDAQKLAVDSSVEYLSNQISKTTEEYNNNVQKCREKADSDMQKIANVGALLFVFFPIFPVILAVLAYYITYSILSSIGLGIMAWFVGWILIFFSTSDSLQNSFYERRIKEYKESYGNELAVLKNNLSKARGEGPQQLQQPLCPTCREPLSYIQQYQYWYCYKCQKYTCPRTKTGETAP